MAQSDLTSRALSGVDRDEPLEGPVFIVVMGVSGTGKSTLGNALAQALQMPYVEGDDLHPQANVAKMSAGQPLNDADREPWLELIRTTAEHKIVELQGEEKGAEAKEERNEKRKCYGVVISCSSLKAYYREILRGNLKPASTTSSTTDSAETKEDPRLPAHLEPAHPAVLPTYFVFINGKRDVLLDRMEKRPGHFMKASMLDSQLNTLEDPSKEEGVVVVSLEISTQEQVRVALDGLSAIAGNYFKEHVKDVRKLDK